jgi:hypothetical protein
MKRIYIILLSVIFFIGSAHSQTHLDQNGWKTSVSNVLSANETQALRFEIASVSYNSYHWQYGGIIFIELFETYFGTGYEKYVVELGFGQGANYGVPILKLTESNGINHNARIVLGSSVDLSSTYGGYVDKYLPIFFDVKQYSKYRIRITYQQDRVVGLTGPNQIMIPENPPFVNISDFAVSTEIVKSEDIVSNGNLRIKGGGDHYIISGNLGLGTTTPQNKLDVNGTIRAKEIKVETGWADFVFNPLYQLKSLTEVEKYIKEYGHLQDIPSAAEVEQNGVNVGEMQTKLLQKVEELTLYVIELKKTIEDQQKQINEFKK